MLLPLLVPCTGRAAHISPHLSRWLEAAGPDERAAVWVFFSDKGLRTPAQLQRDLLDLASSYAAAAVDRRLRARGAGAFDERDLPLARPYVRAVSETGVEVRAFSRWLNAVSVSATAGQVQAIARLPFVMSLRMVSGLRGGPEPLGDSSRGPGAWQDRAPEAPLSGDYGESYTQLQQIQVPALHDEGFTGTGIKVAVFDTGFWLSHETFSTLNVIAEWDFINDDPVTENEPGDPENQHYHGTMCLSIIGGRTVGTLIGPAYDAEYILAKTEDMSQEDPVEEDWWIEAAEWADSLGAQVISSSLCYNDWYTYEDMDGNTAPITIAADLAVQNAAGNSGSSTWKYILAPADGHHVITVGSVDSTGERSYWSSQGPTYDGRIKPTVMAMGDETLIADPVGGVSAYRRGDGTSFATPLVAGAVALMLEKNPLWGPPDVEAAIMNTSTLAYSPDTLCGYGILQALLASEHPQAGISSADPQGRGLLIYPNPARSGFLLSHARGPGSVRVYDVTGRLVGEVRLSPEGVTGLDMDRLTGGAARGVYFLEAGSAGTAKVVILK
jgi:serine protease AprX